MQIVSVSKGTRNAPALNYVTSLGVLRLAEVGRRIYGSNVMIIQVLDVSLSKVGTVLRTKRDAWSNS